MSTAAEPDNAAVRAIPIQKAFAMIGVGPVTGQTLVNSGELESFLIGHRRFSTPAAVDRFIRKRIKASARETLEQRAARTPGATASVAARARKRAQEAA